MKVKHTHTFCGILMLLLFVGLLIALFSQREGYSNNPIWQDAEDDDRRPMSYDEYSAKLTADANCIFNHSLCG